jgi:hypothetical protein
MNEATGGVSEEDYIIFYGRPKQMKSWALAYMAAETLEQKKRVLIYTKEMTPDNLLRRIAAAALQLPYKELLAGKLTPDQKHLLQEYAEYFQNAITEGNLIMINGGDVTPGGDTVGWLQAKVEKYSPDALFIDGLALLNDEASKKPQADHMRVQNISRGLRQLGMRKKIPVIATIHANRKAAGHSEGNLDEIAYSDAVAQDATVAIRTIAEQYQHTMAMIMAGSREFKLDGFRIHAEVAGNFREHSVMDKSDVQKVAERDEQGKAPAKKASKPRTTNGEHRKPGAAPSYEEDATGLTAETDALLTKHFRAMGIAK